MDALDYIDIPIGATRLHRTKNAKSHDIRPSPKNFTSRIHIPAAFDEEKTVDTFVVGVSLLIADPITCVVCFTSSLNAQSKGHRTACVQKRP